MINAPDGDIVPSHVIESNQSQSFSSTRSFFQKAVKARSNSISKEIIRHLDCPWIDPRSSKNSGNSTRTSTSTLVSETATTVDLDIEFGFAKGEPKALPRIYSAPARATRPLSTFSDGETDDEDPFFYDRVLGGFPATPKFLPSAPGLLESPKRQPVLRRSNTVTSFSYPTNIAYPVEGDVEEIEDEGPPVPPKPRRRKRWLGGSLNRLEALKSSNCSLL